MYPSHDFADAIAGAFGSALTYQAPVSRILNSMSRDGVLPSRIFGQISPRFGTPVFAVLCVPAAATCSATRALGDRGRLSASGDTRTGRVI